MRSRTIRLLALTLFVLPALGFDVRTRDHDVVASFFFACPEYKLPARVRAKAYSKESLPPRTASWQIRVFEPGMPPDRAYKVIGEVEALARGHLTTVEDLRWKAREAAEKMGGDALVDLSWRDAGRTKPKVGDPGNFVLTAKVARWEQENVPPIVGK